jgi:ubiquinone biosynthesis monooxygenase Coq6
MTRILACTNRKVFTRSLQLSRQCLSTSSIEYTDVLIAGGGAVGCSLARLLNEKVPSLKVGLLEAGDTPKAPSRAVDNFPHPRSYALSPRSLNILGDSVRSKLELGFYDSMQVWQANSPASLTFSSKDLAIDNALYLGACVEDGPLVEALWNEIQDTTTCWNNTTIESMESSGDSHNLATVTTNKGQKIQTALLIGADGGNSWIRKNIGVSRIGTDYEQIALTFTVALNGSMHKRAFQRFLSDGGPMALLPTYSDNHAVIVWSTTPETIKKWKDAPPEEFVEHLNECLMQGPERVPPLLERERASNSDVFSNMLYGAERVLDTVHYGLAMASHHPIPKFLAPPRIKEIVSPKFSFPISCYQVKSYTKGRVALVGDAAHTVHPMAGQGLNLGLADVEVLVECLEKANAAGMDLSTYLAEYDSNRRRNVTIALGGIHSLQRIFGAQNVPLLHAKTFGMNMIQNLGPLRRQLALAAAHGVSI